MIDLTRQVQELTARVELLTRQRDDARTAGASMQRELEALRAENRVLRGATDAAVDGVRALLPSALRLTRGDVLTEAVDEIRGLEAMLRGAGRSETADGAHLAGDLLAGLSPDGLRAAARVELNLLRVAAEALVDAVGGLQHAPAATPRSSLEARLLADAFAARDRALVALCDALGRPVSDSLRSPEVPT